MFASGIMLAIVIAVISLTDGDRSDRKLYDAINATERGFFETPIHVKYKGGDWYATCDGCTFRPVRFVMPSRMVNRFDCYSTLRQERGEDPHSFLCSLFLLEASAICEYPL